MTEKSKKPNLQLRLERKNRGWTQARLAEAIGADTTLISRWECGERSPALFYQEKLCTLFNKNATELGLIEGDKVTSDATDSFLFTGIQLSLTEDYLQDWSVWFGMKLAQLILIIDSWQGKALFCEQLQAILQLEITGLNVMKPQYHDSQYHLSRRQTLIVIAMLPSAVNSIFQQEATSTLVIEKLLTRCAASITVCWHLLAGSDLALIEQIISTYLLTLTSLAQQSSRYQKTAARLATQAYRLYGIAALHRNNLQAREHFCLKSLNFSRITEDSSLIASAYISLASTYYYRKNPVKAAHTYQQALTQENKLPLLQRSRL